MSEEDVVQQRSPGALKKRRPERKDTIALLLLATPAVIWFLVFAYGPMVGLIVAFKDFNIRRESSAVRGTALPTSATSSPAATR